MAARHGSSLRLAGSAVARVALRRHPQPRSWSERHLLHMRASVSQPGRTQPPPRTRPSRTYGVPLRPCGPSHGHQHHHHYSTATADASPPPPSPPLLLRLKSDLKTAMRARDAPRLSVIRAALAAVTNLSHTSAPVTTDAQLVESVLLRLERTGAESSAEFRAAGRPDLADKEDAQLDVVRAYVAASGVEVLAGEGMREVVRKEVAEVVAGAGAGKARQGDVMKRIMRPGGPLDGKVVDRAEVARLVKELLA